MTAFFTMIKQYFAAFTVLGAAVQSGAQSIKYLAEWAEESAGAFADEARVQRAATAKSVTKAIKAAE